MINHILKASIERGITVTIMYHKGCEITQRKIKALEIDDTCLKAFCYMRNNIRIFKLDNILSAGFVKTFENIAK
jgi:predicted DNA-binding transcriptional regulator YafY